MGQRGPQRTPDEAMDKRGSWRAKARQKQRKPKLKQSKLKAPTPGEAEITRICKRYIPGFSPWKNAKGYTWHADKARAAVRFFHERLKHAKGPKARTPFELENWEIAFVGNLYGWRVRGKPEIRRFTESLLYVARKNGKSPLAAAILVYELFEGGDLGAEIYGAASEYKQASLVFEHARGFVLQDAKLRDECQIFKGQSKSIQLGEDKLFSTYRVVSSDADTAQGFNANAIVIDELHTQPDRKLYDALKTALSGRTNPLLISITTADYDRPGSICNEMRNHAVQVRDGILPDARFLPAIYECSREDDWTKEKVWRKANPNLGVSKRLDYMQEQCERAKRNPAFLNSFLRFDLNIITESHTRWLTKEAWDACGAKYGPDKLSGMECFGGFDLASTRDLTAFVAVYRDDEDVYWLYPWFWVPEAQARRESEEGRDFYRQWVDAGHLGTTPGDMADYAWMRKRLLEWTNDWHLRQIGFDPWNARQFEEQLQRDGFEIVEFRQGFATLTGPTKFFDGLVYSGKLRHPRHPVLNWNAANVCLEHDASDNWKPSKKASSGKIDGIVAAIMAIGLASRGDGAAPSIDWV